MMDGHGSLLLYQGICLLERLLTWGYVPCVCFGFLGPVENMQRKGRSSGVLLHEERGGLGLGLGLSCQPSRRGVVVVSE